jgi:uncharacterized tellurite resistance protein B-like protein
MKELIKSILADGTIDKAEVEQLEKALYEDGKIDKKEAEALFKLNNEATAQCPEFKDLFVKGVKDYILADGKIDDEETEFLCQQISADGEIDDNERALLEALAAEVELPAELAEMLD